MAGDVQLEGFGEFDRRLAALGPRVEKRVVSRAIRKASKVIHTEFVSRLPEDSGRLKRAAAKVQGNIRSLKRSRRGNVGVGVFYPRRDALQIPADAKFYYPAAIEYGTSKQAAQHPLRSAIDMKTNEYLATLRTELGVGIETEAKKRGGST